MPTINYGNGNHVKATLTVDNAYLAMGRETRCR